MARASVADRFEAKVVRGEGCWLWNGCHSRGYAQLWVDGRMQQAHIVAYEMHVGPVPEGLELDHLCRNRGCVRWSHLEAVTRQTNLLRGLTLAAENSRKTHCPRGHEYDEQNTAYTKAGSRRCRACARWRAAGKPE